jgi:signal transduction histidine kinase
MWLNEYGPSNLEVLLILVAIGTAVVLGYWWLRHVWQDKARRLRSELTNSQRQREQLQDQLADSQHERVRFQRELDAAKHQGEQLQDELAAVQNQRELLNEELTEAQRQRALDEARHQSELSAIRDRYDPERIKAWLEGFHEVIAHEYTRDLGSIVEGCEETIAGLRADQPDLRATQADIGILAFAMKQFAGNVVALANLGRAPLKRQMVDLQYLLTNVLEKLHTYAEFSGVTLQPQYPLKRPKPLRVSRYPVWQSISNLVENAITASQSGGVVDITLRVEDGDPPRAIIEVQDYGHGIKPELRMKLFELHMRDDGLPNPGGGIGLHYARETIRQHGGEVELVESKPGEGSLFRITLPYDERSDSASPSEPTDSPPADEQSDSASPDSESDSPSPDTASEGETQ